MNLTRDEEKAYGMGLVDMARRDLRTYVKQGLKCKDIDEAKRLFISIASILDNLSALMGEDVEPLLQADEDDTGADNTDGTGGDTSGSGTNNNGNAGDSGTSGDANDSNAGDATGGDTQSTGAQGGGDGNGD